MTEEGNVHCDGVFSGYYGIDREDGRFVQHIDEDGKEDMGPSARERERWSVYEVSDKARLSKVFIFLLGQYSTVAVAWWGL